MSSRTSSVFCRLIPGVCAAALFTASPARAQTLQQKADDALVTLFGEIEPTDYLSQIDSGWSLERLLQDGGMVWHDANTAEVILAYYEATKDPTYNGIVEAYYGDDVLEPYLGQTNGYNDDDLWWALTLIRAYDDGLTSQTGATKSWYLSEAETIFNHVCSQYQPNWGADSGNGNQGCAGVPQTIGGTYLNSITSELLFETAAKLAIRDPANAGCSSNVSPWGFNNTYEGWAEYENSWFAQYYLTVLGQYPIPDAIDANCNPTGTTWTYNQGPILGALLDMATLASSDPTVGNPDAFLGQAFLVAEVAMDAFQQSSAPGVLTEQNDFGSADACLNGTGDCPQFKGIFMRYLSHLLAKASQQAPGYLGFYELAVPFIQASANSIWQNQDGYGVNAPLYLPEKWTTVQVVPDIPHAGGDPQTSQTSAIDGLLAAMIVPPPPPPPPPPPLSCSYTTACGGTIDVQCTPDATDDPMTVTASVAGAVAQTLSLSSAGVARFIEGGATNFSACVEKSTGRACNPAVVVTPDTLPCTIGSSSGGGGGGGGYGGPSGCVGRCDQ